MLRSSVDSLRVRSGSSAETFAQLERTLHSNQSTLSSLPLVEVIDDLDNDAELEVEPENESENEKEDPPPPFITLPGFERENDTLRVTVHAPQYVLLFENSFCFFAFLCSILIVLFVYHSFLSSWYA